MAAGGCAAAPFSDRPLTSYTQRCRGISVLFPDIPAIAEALPDFVSDTWYALAAPPGTPPDITRKLAEAITDALARPD